MSINRNFQENITFPMATLMLIPSRFKESWDGEDSNGSSELQLYLKHGFLEVIYEAKE